MTDEKLTPERAVRLLRAKGAELEAIVLAHRWEELPAGVSPVTLAADIALIALLLADHIERMEDLVAHPMQVIQAQEPRDGWENAWGPDHPDYDEMGQ